MPRIRTLKPEFFRSPDTACVDFPVRIFYQALWCWADDFGVGETNLNGLLGFAFPDEDGFTAQDLRQFCADVAHHYGVTFYTVRGRHYYAVQTWEKHQKLESRADRRKYPPPDDPDARPDQRIYGRADPAPEIQRETGAELALEQGNRGTGENLKLTLVEGVQGETPAKRKRSTQIRDDYMPSRNVVDAIRSENPQVTDTQLSYQHRKFIDHWKKTGKPMRDWDAAWRNWMRTAGERGDFARTPGNSGVGKPTQKAMGYQAAAERLIAGMEDHD